MTFWIGFHCVKYYFKFFSIFENKLTRSFVRKMSAGSFNFVPHFNHVCNKMEWKVVSDDYDYNQEIATSCYGDMLHDVERNQKFGLALKKAIKYWHSIGRNAHVLDIGTGTGLLSMLAVRYGADTVMACESFVPMAECAIKIIEQNGFSKCITVTKKRSTALTVGVGKDIPFKANILVSEVFDTELIGEGAIKTFNHAHQHLLEDNCIVIPSVGTVYAQVIESETAKNWNQLQDWKLNDKLVIKIPDDIAKCPGATAVHDIQLSQLKPDLFKPLTDCVPIFKFDWSSKNPIPTYRRNDITLEAINTGKAQVLFLWWDLQMDPEGEIILSCAPVWEHPYSKSKYMSKEFQNFNLTKCMPWRDHWMQAVYYFIEETNINKGDVFTLNCHHDEFSYWFEINQTYEKIGSSGKNACVSFKPACLCGVHFSVSRTRIGALNCTKRQEFFVETLTRFAKEDANFVVFSDMTLLGHVLDQLGVKKVNVHENSTPLLRALKRIADHNFLGKVNICSNVPQIANNIIEEGSTNIFIISEAFFRNSLLPWDNISFWYLKEELINAIKAIKPDYPISIVRTFPSKGKIMGCAVKFDNLWKISRKLNNCEGFSMKVFDDLIERAKIQTESYIESQPLWEYPGVALTHAFTLFEFNFADEIPKQAVVRQGRVSFPISCYCDGFALWMLYYDSDGSMLCTGPEDCIILNQYISWDMFERQGVHLFRNSLKVNQGDVLFYQVKFFPEGGDFNFKFKINSPFRE